MTINIKSEREVALMRQAGKIVATVLAMLAEKIEPGLKTKELDIIAEKEIKRLGGIPSFKGYRGYPASLCVSINDEIVHGIPGERVLKEGDIVSLDLGAIYRGYQGDAARTMGVNGVSIQAAALMQATEDALLAGIKMARPENRLGDISAAIQRYAESRGFSVVREYTGHGIGRQMHEEPLIPNFGSPGTGPVLKRGMTLAIEPMLNAGDWRTRLGSNGWTVSTADGQLSAHFENTIVITDGEAEILTLI
ncbi:MAG: map [Chloroflexi bacterium]|nr:map [Chloroflexota bacterium]